MCGMKISSVLLGCLFIAFFLSTYTAISFFILEHRAPIITNQLPEIPNTKSSRPNRKYHVALTANNVPATHWESRLVYSSYKKIKDMPGSSDMGAFTRILHSGKPDHLMDEIPTFVVNPLPNGRDQNYAPMNRAWAFVQWLELAVFEEEYVLMVEPDHIFINPLPNLAYGELPAAYHFSYITPSTKESVIRKFFPIEKGPMTYVDPIGSSPVIIKKNMLKKIASTWIDLAMKMRDDPECNEAFGWVSEMYAYAVASALHGVRHILYNNFIVQPPFSLKIENAFIIHYTYGMGFNEKGELVEETKGIWHFNKRDYHLNSPKNLTRPPLGSPETVITLVDLINEAAVNLPNW